MSENQAQQGGRNLAEIETGLLSAEKAFADADARFKDAERDRRTALDAIDKHQIEMDNFISEMHRRSMPGTKWRQELEAIDETLELHSQDIIAEEVRSALADKILTSEKTKEGIAKDLDRLRATAHSKGDDPVLRVVAVPRG
jgi:hypothetical protein